MLIIDDTYFERGILFIPNNKDLNASPIATPSVKSELSLLIDIYERELLINALGVELFNELKTAVTDLPNANQKWRDLIDGKTYTKDNKNFLWDGLKGFSKQSLIAFYVKCEYLAEKDTGNLTTIGVVSNKAENADNTSYSPLFVKLWNVFLNKYQNKASASPKIIQNSSGEIGLDYSSNKTTSVSLYQFLSDNDADFVGFKFSFYDSINTFGI